jgi:fatty acid synthase subunit alpha
MPTSTHSSTAIDHDLRKSFLTDYFLALSTLEAHFSTDDVPRTPPSALLTAAKDGKAGIYALFGGQGANEVYFDELKALYDIYKPYVASLIVKISKDVLEPLAMKAETEGLRILLVWTRRPVLARRFSTRPTS